MKKRCISLILCLSFILMSFHTLVFADSKPIQLHIENISYVSTDAIKVPVYIKNNTGIKGANLVLSFDKNVLGFSDAQVSTIFKDCTIDYSIETKDEINTLSVNIVDTEHLYNASGELCVLTFNVLNKEYISPIPFRFSGESGTVIDSLQENKSVAYVIEELHINDLFTISFDTNGGTEIPKKEYHYGDVVTEIPEKAEYDFAGWYKDVALTEKWDETDIVTSDMVLYSKWIPTTQVIDDISAYIYDGKCNVQFSVYGKTSLEDNTAIVQLNSEIGQVAAITTHNFDITANETVTIPIEFYLNNVSCELGEKPFVSIMIWNPFSKGTNIAKMKSITTGTANKISFNENYSDGKIIVKYIDNSNTEYALPVPEREGYTFVGWTTSDGSDWIIGTPFAKDETLYAKYSQNVYTVKLYGVSGEISEQSVAHNGILTEPSFSVEDYELDGWYTSSGEKWNFVENRVTESINLYARCNAPNVTITFNTTAEASQIDKQNLKYGDKIPVPTEPTREGCTFAGWYSESNYSEESKWNFDIRVYNDTTLYAKWLCNITFDSMGGTAVEAQTIVAGGTVLNATSTRDGFEFVGWYTDDGQKWIFDGADGATSAMKDTKLHARWLSGWVVASSQPADTDINSQKWISDYKVTTTSDSSTLSGWTYEKTTSVWSDYGNWSDWNRNTQYYDSDSRDAEQQTWSEWIDTSHYEDRWRYYHWCNSRSKYNLFTYKYNSSYVYHEINLSYTMGIVRYASDGTAEYGEYWCDNSPYWFPGGFSNDNGAYYNQVWVSSGYTNYYNVWRYRDRRLIYTYHFYKYEPGKETTFDPSGQDGYTNVVKWIRHQTR